MFGVHGSYWVWPLLAVIVWTATLLGLLLWWIIDDNAAPYMLGETTVVYISDVGAAHKALFVSGTALTLLFFSITLLTERWLRHVRRIPGVLRGKERWSSVLAVIFGMLGGLALLMLSIFDAFNHDTVHWILTAVFIVCIAVSCLFQTLEVMWLERDHPDRRHLRIGAVSKLSILVVALAGAVVFAGTYAACSATKNQDVAPTGKCNVVGSVAAAFEWFIAFLYDAYLATYIIDLWPARFTAGHTFDPSLIEADKMNVLKAHKDPTQPGVPGGPDRQALKEGETLPHRLAEVKEVALAQQQNGVSSDPEKTTFSSRLTNGNTTVANGEQIGDDPYRGT